jgi:hypothetical protein
MEKLSENLRAIIEKETQKFKDLSQYLYKVSQFIKFEHELVIQKGELIDSKFHTPDFLDKVKFSEIIDRIGPTGEKKECFLEEIKYVEGKKYFRAENLLEQYLNCRISEEVFKEDPWLDPNSKIFKTLRPLFPSNGIYKFVCNFYFNPENFRQEKKVDPASKRSWRLFLFFHLQSYSIFKLYENFDAFSSAMQIKPDKLFYDLWLIGSYIKEKSNFFIGYWTMARDAVHKPIKSAKFKTIIAEKNTETVKNLLFEKYSNKASEDFYFEAMKTIGRKQQTVQRMVKKIREEAKKSKTDGIT